MSASTNSDVNETKVHQPHDTSYKFLLSSKKLFVELLRSFINKSWVNGVDENQIEEIPHSFVLPDFKRKEADLIYRVKLNGQDIVFYLLLELQSRVDFRMPYRLLLYQVELWRYLLQNVEHSLVNRKTFGLPPIIPIVLYNGKPKWTASRQLRNLFANAAMFDKELLDFEYILIDVARYTEKELLSLSNTIGAVFLLDQTEDREQLLERLAKLMLTIGQLSTEGQQKLLAWIGNILLQKLPDNEPGIRELMKKEKGAASFMGLEKVLDDIEQRGRLAGEQNGKQQAREQVVKQMLAEQLDVELIARVTGFSLTQIEQLRERN